MEKLKFKANGLTLDEKVKILNDSYNMCFTHWVDKLDCKESFLRQCIDMSFEEVMQKFDDSCIFTLLHRIAFTEQEHIEVGFCTLDPTVSYYLWIQVSMEHLSIYQHLID